MEHDMGKVCILVVSHNFPALTDSLCDKIVQNTKGVDYDLHVIETGSSLDNCSKYATLWVKDGCRMTRGFNLLKAHADAVLKYKTGERYDAYMLFVNDAKFIDDQDMVSILYNEMKKHPDCGQIHPYQSNMHSGFRRLCKMTEGETRKESFSEIVCPMILADAWDECGEDFLDNRFFYGWGLDYDMPYQLHKNGYRTYITDKIGVFHDPFTSYKNKEQTKEKLEVNQFAQLARQNMNQGFVQKYGTDWMQVLMDGVPADVSKEALYMWLSNNDGFRGRL
jgi:GT2 family glycosyltransferase